MAEAGLGTQAPVCGRVARFYRDHPDGSIRTFMVKHDGGDVVFEARVYRTPEEASLGIYTSGWAHAEGGAGDPLERCESGAVARALAHLGYDAQAGGDGDVTPPPGAGARRPMFSEETLPLFAEVA